MIVSAKVIHGIVHLMSHVPALSDVQSQHTFAAYFVPRMPCTQDKRILPIACFIIGNKICILASLTQSIALLPERKDLKCRHASQ